MSRPLCQIHATPAAVEALERLRREHGGIVLHIAGGAEEAGTPQAFAVGELRVGSRDVLLGSVQGVEIYEQASQPHAHFRAGWGSARRRARPRARVLRPAGGRDAVLAPRLPACLTAGCSGRVVARGGPRSRSAERSGRSANASPRPMGSWPEKVRTAAAASGSPAPQRSRRARTGRGRRASRSRGRSSPPAEPASGPVPP
ncbi:DUF779 domain-containing protein [Actinomycetospora sp. NBRC 106378]|uniref:DUF779 domain-containing protein n=1 Tax=Actinomycetospora sp. NBRC 106378 TaxID=3032208 RepID=UPI003318E2C8